MSMIVGVWLLMDAAIFYIARKRNAREVELVKPGQPTNP